MRMYRGRSGSVAQARIDSETPSFVAIAAVAPGVLFSDLDIFLTPALAFAMSSSVARRLLSTHDEQFS